MKANKKTTVTVYDATLRRLKARLRKERHALPTGAWVDKAINEELDRLDQKETFEKIIKSNEEECYGKEENKETNKAE